MFGLTTLDTFVNISLFLIMLVVGTSLDFSYLKKILKFPKAIITGLVLQIIFLPALAFFIVELFPIPDYIKLGVIVIAACPGGATSNFICYLAKIDTEISVIMTSINSFITLLTIPLIVNLALYRFQDSFSVIKLPILTTILSVLGIVIIPAIIGLILKYNFKPFIEKYKNHLKIITSSLLALVFFFKIIAKTDAGGVGLTVSNFFQVLPVVLLLHVGGLFLGLIIAKMLKHKNNTAITIGVEVGMQNTALAFMVSSIVLLMPEIALPAVVYAAFSFWTTLLFAAGMRIYYEGGRLNVKKLFFE